MYHYVRNSAFFFIFDINEISEKDIMLTKCCAISLKYRKHPNIKIDRR